MIDKRKDVIQTDDILPTIPEANRTTPSPFPAIVFVIAYALCALLMVAPLSRIPDPVIRLTLPFGSALAQVGARLPINLGLNSNALASQTATNLLEFLGLVVLSF